MPDMNVASTTATQEQIDHAASPNWREPMPEKVVTPEVVVEKAAETEPPVAPEEEAETVPAPEAEDEQETEEQQRPQKGKGGFQKKIDKLTREKGELAATLLEFRDKFAALEERLAKPAVAEEKPETKTANDKPSTDQIGAKFKDYEEFNEALIAWKAAELLKETLATRDKETQEREAREIQEARNHSYSEAAKEFAKTNPDFNDAISEATEAGMKLPEQIVDLLKELPNGPAVTYYLVKNPDVALGLIEKSIPMGLVEIGRIAHSLDAPPPAPKAPAPKKVSSAPPPVRPVAGHSARSSTPLAEMTTDEFIRTRNQQERDKAARRYS